MNDANDEELGLNYDADKERAEHLERINDTLATGGWIDREDVDILLAEKNREILKGYDLLKRARANARRLEKAEKRYECKKQEISDLEDRLLEREALIAELRREIIAHRKCDADVKRLTRALDVALHGEANAAPQASLCDLVGAARGMHIARRNLIDEVHHLCRRVAEKDEIIDKLMKAVKDKNAQIAGCRQEIDNLHMEMREQDCRF